FRMALRSRSFLIRIPILAFEFLFSLAALGMLHAAQVGDNPAPTGRPGATELFVQWLKQWRNSGGLDHLSSEALTNGIRLARARSLEMRSLMERNPEEFARQA